MPSTYVEQFDKLHEEIFNDFKTVTGTEDCILELTSPVGSDFSPEIAILAVVKKGDKIFLLLKSQYVQEPYMLNIEEVLISDLAFTIDEIKKDGYIKRNQS